MSYLPVGFGVKLVKIPLPARSTSTSSFSRAFMARMYRTSRQRGVSVPLIDTKRSPARSPACAAAEPGSTYPMTAGASS